MKSPLTHCDVRLRVAAIGIASLANVAAAQPQGVHHVAVSLVAETRGVIPGRPFHLALRQQIEPGWHTYWSNPGDSGLPTAIDWVLPPDFQAGAIVWPTPERFTVGPVVDYGYQHDILLPVTIDIPANLQPGSNVTIAAHASWLVCSDTCIAEDAPVSLSVPVVMIAEPDPMSAAAFAEARARTPAPNPFPTSAIAEKDKLILRVAAVDATRLPAAWCITCQVNERVALSDPVVRRAFAERGVATLRADWTRQDASITRILEANGRAGVPLYLVYPKAKQAGENRPPIILPQILTVDAILREISAP